MVPINTWRSINVARVLEEVVWLNMDKVRSKVPDILSVIDDADHVVATRKK